MTTFSIDNPKLLQDYLNDCYHSDIRIHLFEKTNTTYLLFFMPKVIVEIIDTYLTDKMELKFHRTSPTENTMTCHVNNMFRIFFMNYPYSSFCVFNAFGVYDANELKEYFIRSTDKSWCMPIVPVWKDLINANMIVRIVIFICNVLLEMS